MKNIGSYKNNKILNYLILDECTLVFLADGTTLIRVSCNDCIKKIRCEQSIIERRKSRKNRTIKDLNCPVIRDKILFFNETGISIEI